MNNRRPLISINYVVSLGFFLLIVGIYSCTVAIPHGLNDQQAIRQQIASITASISQFIPVAIVITLAFDLILDIFMILWDLYKRSVYTKGRSEGIIEQQHKWESWNARRRKAEAEGTKFDEPPPNAEYRSAIDESVHTQKN